VGIVFSRSLKYGSVWLVAWLACSLARGGAPTPAPLDAHAAAEQFTREIVPILETHCYACHGDGGQEGSVTLDEFATPEAAVADRQLWFRALRMLRAGMMPPAEYDRPTRDEIATLESWIKRGAFAIDPENPDPGRVTVRRLNRIEYSNTIRDLMGVRFDAQTMFPPDDTGHGFDNIGDVLTISPLHLEKYIEAAEEIVAEGVPTEPPDEDGDRERRRQYRRFFAEPPPEDADQRRAYVVDVLKKFVMKAFRRPADDATVERLADLAQSVYEGEQTRVEAGIARAMTAVLASPRFLFREEQLEDDPGHTYPLVDQYSLASRLSYFLWSSMPDDELMELAEQGQLRDQLPEQVERMLKANKAEEFIRQYAGQWLRARDIETTQVDARAVLGRENPDDERDRIRQRFRELQRKDPESLTEAEREELDQVRRQFRRRFGRFRDAELDREMRQAMKRETEMLLERIVQEDRSLLELIDADYTYLNERLAKHYGIEGVTGDKMQLVELPEDSVRGGVLTQGTTLVITSNPDRTSPAKRGLYVLETLLGTPPPPPPPDIPSLEQSEKGFAGRTPTARELLELHRADPVCSSCHNRMDPIGLALENFNALGMFREKERGESIDATGELITGENFEGIRELKRILVEDRSEDFLRCATEKMLTYALGRGLEYNDVEAVDGILDRVIEKDGRPSALLKGIVESAPFLRSRWPEAAGEQTAAVVDAVSAQASH
jgi:mono/diheme cytochrome c family protein